VRDRQKLRDVVADALVHLLPEIDVMRIERVVEIEYPGLDLPEIAPRYVTGASACRRRGR